MGRKQSYFCDTCKKEFGDKPHVNIEGFNISIAHKQNDRWNTTRELPRRFTHLHFCNSICVNDWLAKQVEELFERIGGE